MEKIKRAAFRFLGEAARFFLRGGRLGCVVCLGVLKEGMNF